MADDTTNLLPLLKKISTEQNYRNPDITISPLSTGGANYTSRLYLVTIKSNGKEGLKLFAKIAALGEEMRNQFNFKPYECERFMYTELIKIYRSLEDRYSLSERHKLAVPKYFGANATRLQEIIVLEDLSCQGYTVHNRLETVSWEYAAAAVTELAKFHSLSLAFQHHCPDEFHKTANKFKRGLFEEKEKSRTFLNSSVKSAMAAVRVEHKEKLQNFVDGMSLTKFFSFYEPLRCQVLIHGDYKPSNMLHRGIEDGKTEAIVVDYQTIRAGCPVIDLLMFLFTATDGQFRARHHQRLLDHYYVELGAALARLGLDVEKQYAREDFQYELQEKLPYGLHLTVIYLPVLLKDEKEAPPLDDKLNVAKMTVKATGDLYKKRLNEVVDDYVAWGILE